MNITVSSAPMQAQNFKKQNQVAFKANETLLLDIMKKVKTGEHPINDHWLQTMDALAQTFEPKKHPDLLKEAKKLANEATGVIKKALNDAISYIPKS